MKANNYTHELVKYLNELIFILFEIFYIMHAGIVYSTYSINFIFLINLSRGTARDKVKTSTYLWPGALQRVFKQ